MVQEIVKRKIILIGDGAVGKTSLIRRFVYDRFDDRYITTIGTKVSKKDLTLKVGGKEYFLKMVIWDILGQQGYTSVQRTGYRGSDGAIFVCDYTRPETLASLENYWIPEVTGVVGRVPMVFVANKNDLVDRKMFSEDDVKKVASKYGASVFSTSAKTGENVEAMFRAMGELVLSEEMGREKSGGVVAGVGAGGVSSDMGSGTGVVTNVVGGRMPGTGGSSGGSSGRPSVGAGGGEKKITLVEATDFVIEDFCNQFGGPDMAMPIIQEQFRKAGLDVKNPTRNALYLAIEYLADVEKGFKPREEVINNRNRRRRIVSMAVDTTGD